ncbi:hypothetical protein Dsin_022964 [Dipteronia sinensis]|uniref:FBD domain-containing protein n=1 Tax=Dipteronia sinensis TaxID=43782 RepID=A0AAE0A2P6_9ROSI|nr:hypothetical protein Dsin_022964 [Dipteronia sinensis]
MNGSRTSDPRLIREGIYNFFKNHYKKVLWDRPKIRGLDFKKVSIEDSISLERPFSKEEVWEAVCSCDGNKAPGPDGFNLNFIKANWEVIQEDFLEFISGFHSDGHIVKELNSTLMALIPKCARPELLSDFRPISLVGSLYKVLAKVLANRLKKVMGTIISEPQMAFVKDRQILDSFIIAEEIIHKWRKKEEGGLLVKLDFEKACNLKHVDYIYDIRNCLSILGNTFVVFNHRSTNSFADALTKKGSGLSRSYFCWTKPNHLWKMPNGTTPCLKYHHKIVELFDVGDDKYELDLVRFFLENGHVLQKMRISWFYPERLVYGNRVHGNGNTDEFISEVMKFPTSSSNIALTFVKPESPISFYD